MSGLSRARIAGELVGATEAAAILGVQTSTVTSYLARGQIVAPLVTLACGPVWLRADLVRWHAGRPGRQDH